MTVNSIKKAWEIADALIPTDYNKSETRSIRAGYDVYEGAQGDYICDLGDRLEVNLTSGESINIWIEPAKPATTRRKYKSHAELHEIAGEIAATIVIRTYVNGCSNDTRRATTEAERDTIHRITLSALHSLNFGEDVRGSADMSQAIIQTAEFMIISLLPAANSYNTVYLPLQRALSAWEKEA